MCCVSTKVFLALMARKTLVENQKIFHDVNMNQEHFRRIATGPAMTIDDAEAHDSPSSLLCLAA